MFQLLNDEWRFHSKEEVTACCLANIADGSEGLANSLIDELGMSGSLPDESEDWRYVVLKAMLEMTNQYTDCFILKQSLGDRNIEEILLEWAGGEDPFVFEYTEILGYVMQDDLPAAIHAAARTLVR